MKKITIKRKAIRRINSSFYVGIPYDEALDNDIIEGDVVDGELIVRE